MCASGERGVWLLGHTGRRDSEVKARCQDVRRSLDDIVHRGMLVITHGCLAKMSCHDDHDDCFRQQRCFDMVVSEANGSK